MKHYLATKMMAQAAAVAMAQDSQMWWEENQVTGLFVWYNAIDIKLHVPSWSH